MSEWLNDNGCIYTLEDTDPPLWIDGRVAQKNRVWLSVNFSKTVTAQERAEIYSTILAALNSNTRTGVE